MHVCYGLGVSAFYLAVAGASTGGLLPEPSGEYGIGTISFDWVDSERVVGFPESGREGRRLAVRIWYPAASGSGTPTKYLRDPDYWVAIHGERARGINDAVEVHARLNAAAAPGSGPLPVVLFSPGANQPRCFYQSWFEEWASHGFVVVAIAHPGANRDTFDDGTHMEAHREWSPPANLRTVDRDDELYHFWEPMIRCLSADQRFVLDQLRRVKDGEIDSPLRGRLKVNRVIVAGHSRGAKAAYRTSRLDPRVLACIVMDDPPPPQERDGIPVPLLAMMPKQASAANRTHTSTLFANMRSPMVWAEMDGATHMSFSDLPLIAPEEWDLSREQANRIHRRIRRLTTDFLHYCVTNRPYGVVGGGQPLAGTELRIANMSGE